MSIYSALNVGISGILAQSDAINTISSNIANADTTGYKEGMTSFAELVENSTNNYSVNGSGSADAYLSYSGVSPSDISLNDVQGVISGSNSETDLAISGAGFFAVSPTATDATSNLEYTRAGSFTPDADGNYANAAGDYLMGWALNPDGTLPADLSGSEVSSGTAIAALEPVNIQNIITISVPTTTVSVAANLNASQAAYAGTYDPTNPADNMASGAVPPDFTIPITVVDSTGANHTLDADFLNTGTNSWAVELVATPASDVTATDGQVAYGTATFNGDGTLASISSSLTSPVPITWTDTGAAGSDITFNWGTAGAIGTGEANGLGQSDSAYDLVSVQQNGLQANTSTTVSVSSSGVISVAYSGGGTRDLYQIPLAQFANPDQLQTLNANSYAPTVDSGKLTFFSPGQNTQAVLAPDALEDSNVDLSTQLSNLVIAQNAYQSNSQLVSVSDQMLQTLTSMDQPITV